MVQRLPRGSGQWLVALVALGALTACASTSSERGAGEAAGGWRVIERVGEARHSPPGEATWRATITGQPIVDGSEVATGRGGRLIIAMPGRHISVGPASRFVLPSSDWDDRLEQRAGWLRYRVESTEPFRVRTRSLEIEFVTAILDVRVDQDAVDVTVTEGKVRLATPDGLRRIEVAAGQSARAGGSASTQLAVRDASHRNFEPVEPLIIPAIQPGPVPTATVPATSQSPTAPADALPSPPALDLPRPAVAPAPRASEAIRIAPADEGQDPDEAAGSTDQSGPAAVSAPVGQARSGRAAAQASAIGAVGTIPPATGRRGQFQRLTEGIIEGVRSPAPTSTRP